MTATRQILKSSIVLTMLTATLLNCSTTRFTRTNTQSTAALSEAAKVFVLTPMELPPNDAIEIGDYEHIEDWNGAWDFLMNKIQRKAREKGANIMKIDAYLVGSKTRGHGLLIRGKFYASKSDTALEDHVKKERTKNVSDCNCSYIKVFRDEGNAAIRALFQMDLVVNDSLVGELTNKKAYSIKLTKESDVFIGVRQVSPDFLVKNKFGTEYYVQATQVMTSPSLGDIRIGAKSFFLIESLAAKAHFETIEKTYK